MTHFTPEALLDLFGDVDVDELQKVISDLIPESPYEEIDLAFDTKNHSVLHKPHLGAPLDTSNASACTGLDQSRKKPNRKPSYNSNRARNSRAREIARLRQEVTRMSRDIGWSQASALEKSNDRAFHEYPVPTGERGAGVRIVGVWARVAAKQQEQRYRSERRNRQLKQLVEVQHRIARLMENLSRAVAKHTLSMELPGGEDVSNKLDDLLGQVDEGYAEAERVLSEMGDDSHFTDPEAD